MTTSRDRAVEIMRGFWKEGRYAAGFDEIADALDAEGVLKEDLPEPTGASLEIGTGWKGYEVENVYIYAQRGSGEIRVKTGGEIALTLADTRAVITAFTDAANYAGKEPRHG